MAKHKSIKDKFNEYKQAKYDEFNSNVEQYKKEYEQKNDPRGKKVYEEQQEKKLKSILILLFFAGMVTLVIWILKLLNIQYLNVTVIFLASIALIFVPLYLKFKKGAERKKGVTKKNDK